MNRKTIFWLILAFVGGGIMAARQNVIRNLPPPPPAKIYLVALDDDGKTGPKIGCGDSLIEVQRPQTVPAEPVRAALTELFQIKEERYGESGLYNALYQSNLQIEDVKLTEKKVLVRLKGTLKLGGTCDAPRVNAQLEKTIQTAAGVNQVEILLNGKPLSASLSEKG